MIKLLVVLYPAVACRDGSKPEIVFIPSVWQCFVPVKELLGYTFKSVLNPNVNTLKDVRFSFGGYEYYCLLELDAVRSGRNLQLFRRTSLFPSVSRRMYSTLDVEGLCSSGTFLNYFYHSGRRRVSESSKPRVHYGLCRRETRSDTNVNHSRELSCQEFLGNRVSGGGGGGGGKW